MLFVSGCFNSNGQDNNMQRRFCSQIQGLQVNEVNRLLLQGADPNKCIGEFGWIDNNPLFVIPTYLTLWRDEGEIQVPFPDSEILNLLLDAGADINARPYVWFKVFAYDNDNIKRIKEQKKYQGELDENPIYKRDVETLMNDVNRFIDALLKAGANPDALGHPYPFSHEAISNRITDIQAKEYFARGTRAINVAIEKGIIWESQVDLLLQYTKLDEESLKAAECSNDPAMVEKINRLWEIQQGEVSTN